ncbi:MAG: hemZ [Alphaproteobacteria bacterium]|jgi:oxygen-independent coproporphyrinogen-3 oxidase|nr:hemZ [Alphaproteobacteria bacterium]
MHKLQPLALYIHWPFCLSKCPYCDFNSHVRASLDEDSWEEALLKELDHTAKRIGARQLTSIFFGGGTPSLMRPQTVGALINRALYYWPATSSLEITLEANPNSVEVGRFQDLRGAGVNRVSIGVQALNDADLKQLGRQHDANEAMAAITTARNIFERVSFDLIYARPHQSLDAWQQELTQALSFGTEHLSLYQLTIEPGTAFAPMYERGDLIIPSEDLAADLFELTQSQMTAAGLPAYEISNHAQIGCESRHNLSYWHYEDYAGIGPGAHGRITLAGRKFATKQYRAPETWMTAVMNGSGEEESLCLSSEEQATEALMMGLRLTSGIQLSSFPFLENTVMNSAALNILVDSGYLILTETTLKATPLGLQCLNAVLRRLLSPS